MALQRAQRDQARGAKTNGLTPPVVVSQSKNLTFTNLF